MSNVRSTNSRHISKIRTLSILVSSLVLVEAFACVAGAVMMQNGDLIIADSNASGTHRLLRVDIDGLFVEEISSGGLLRRPSGVAVDASTGSIFASNQLGTTADTGKIIRIDISDVGVASQTVVADGHGANGIFGTLPSGELRHPRHIAFEPSGTLVAAERSASPDSVTGANGIVRVDLSQGEFINQSVVASGTPFDDPLGIAVAPNGDIFLADRIGTDDLFIVSSDGSSIIDVDALTGNAIVGAAGVTIGATNGSGQATAVFVAELQGASSEIFRVDLTYTGPTLTGATATSISTGTGGNPFTNTLAVVLGLNGSVFATDATHDGVYEITDPFGSPTTLFHDLTTFGGSVSFTSFDPNGITVFYQAPPVPEPSTATLLVLGCTMASVARRSRKRKCGQ